MKGKRFVVGSLVRFVAEEELLAKFLQIEFFFFFFGVVSASLVSVAMTEC